MLYNQGLSHNTLGQKHWRTFFIRRAVTRGHLGLEGSPANVRGERGESEPFGNEINELVPFRQTHPLRGDLLAVAPGSVPAG